MNKSTQSPSPEQLKNLENDAVWSLLDEASTQIASSTFTDQVMNAVRSEIPENVVTSPSFWKRYSLPISAAAVAGIAACVMITLSSQNSQSGDTTEIADQEIELTNAELVSLGEEMGFTSEEVVSEIDALATQMIEIDNEDPFIMTADDINLLVSM